MARKNLPTSAPQVPLCDDNFAADPEAGEIFRKHIKHVDAKYRSAKEKGVTEPVIVVSIMEAAYRLTGHVGIHAMTRAKASDGVKDNCPAAATLLESGPVGTNTFTVVVLTDLTTVYRARVIDRTLAN